jgi:RND family efflux transporter MFP subunit
MTISKINFNFKNSSMNTIKITTLVLSSLFLLSCGGEKKNEIATETPIAVKVSATTENSNSPYVTASGKIESQNSANVSTRMMGYVTKVHVKMGQKVSAGQLLMSINNADLQAKKAQVDASILQATAGFKNAKKDYERFQNLIAQQSASQKELDDMTSRYEMAKAGLEGAKQMRNEVIAQFSYANITAPFSGEVTNTFVKEGDMANPGMPLVSVEGNGLMQVMAMVSEGDISSITNGMPVTVLVKSSNQQIKGKVSEISGSATNTGGQYLVKINLEKADKNVLSGMFVNVKFPIEKPKATTETKTPDKVLVPTSALVKQGQLTGIYTVSSEKTALLRWLRIGKNFGDQVEVLSGLAADEKYIVSAEGKLYNGVSVSVQ